MESSKVRMDPDDDLLASSDSEEEDSNISPKKNGTNDSAGINIYFCESYFNSTMGGRDVGSSLSGTNCSVQKNSIYCL